MPLAAFRPAIDSQGPALEAVMQIRSTLHVLWFRRDLRLDDHPALLHACRLGPVLPLFILDPALLHHPETGAARVQLMLRQLQALDRDLRQRGSALVLRHGEPLQELLTPGPPKSVSTQSAGALPASL